jgi:hypothetical protein
MAAAAGLRWLTCTCAVQLDALKDQLQPALKTEREIERARVQSRPRNLARLTRILAYVVFDDRGKWLVHASCLQSHLQCSSNFAANVHRVSIALHDVPLEEMSVERMRALRLMDYVVLPTGCPVSVREFPSVPAAQTVHVNKAKLVSAHGLFGLASNRGTAVQVQELMFGEFFRSNRVATGRTPDAHERFHGAVFYFYAKFTALKSAEEVQKKRRKEPRGSVHIPAFHVRADAAVSAVFNASLVEAGMKAISATIVLVWLRDLFGKGTPEDTSLAPHHTDACSECVIVTATE